MDKVEAIDAYRCECCGNLTIVFYDAKMRAIAFASLPQDTALAFRDRVEAALMIQGIDRSNHDGRLH